MNGRMLFRRDKTRGGCALYLKHFLPAHSGVGGHKGVGCGLHPALLSFFQENFTVRPKMRRGCRMIP